MAAFNLTKLLLAMTGYTLAAATSMDIREAAASPSDTSFARRQMGVTIPANECATNLLCCNSLTYASDPATAAILQLLGINVGGLYTVGLTCQPMSYVGVVGSGAASQCAAQPLCCWWGAQYNYVVAIDCVAVN
ncbi:hypothetical protein BJ912DRAFT_969573 [Pholiota molesta]|nr:hypothetical protein BJ912DRAFT_969573 [Pholiota molesta]